VRDAKSCPNKVTSNLWHCTLLVTLFGQYLITVVIQCPISHYYFPGHHSQLQALADIYPEVESKAPRKQVPNGHWSSIQNQRDFFDKLAIKLNITNPENWYNVTVNDIVQNGGSGILKRYNSSLIRALTLVYPERHWEPYRFYQPHQNQKAKDVNTPNIMTEEYLASLKESLGSKVEQIRNYSRDLLNTGSKVQLLEFMIGDRYCNYLMDLILQE
jgi:hypothetical protein